MKQYVAFLDESGDPNFNDKASKTFLVAAVVFSKDSLAEISSGLSAILKLHRLSRLKSNEIGDFKRRLAICTSLAGLSFHIATVTVNKNELDPTLSQWFMHKRGFYKYIQRALNSEICRLFSPQEITIDKYGTPAYQKSFQEYLNSKLQRELFESDVNIDSADANGFVQVGDFIAGSLRKALDGDFEQAQKEELLALFRSRWAINKVIPDIGKYVKPIVSKVARYSQYVL